MAFCLSRFFRLSFACEPILAGWWAGLMGWVDGSRTGTQNEHGSKKPVLLEGIQESIMARCDWSVPVRSLLHKMQMAGFNITAVHDGEEMIQIDQNLSKTEIKHAVSYVVVSVDESFVYINKDGMRARLWIVLGNEPEEIVADYNYNPQLEELLEETMDEYILQWEGKKCPMIED